MSDIFFMLLICSLFLGFLAMDVSALVRWKGTWKVGALLPLFAVGFIVVRIVVDTRADPTSHNLWPFELVMWSFLGLSFLGVLFGIRSMLDHRAHAKCPKASEYPPT